MKVLLLKTSSLGDLIHVLPSLTDAARSIPDIRFDWVVEEAFDAIPRWHPAVDRVIPIALRRWRQQGGKAWSFGEIGHFVQELRREHYDLIIDAQGLFFKSALPGVFAIGPRAGFGWDSAREPWAALTYQHRHSISKGLHAVERNRRLFAQALDYPVDLSYVEYGIELPMIQGTGGRDQPYLVFLHATTWPTKHWPEAYWAVLAILALEASYRVVWPWHTPEERLRAERLIAMAGGELAPRQGLNGMAQLLAGATAVVGVDSGLAHMAAALGRPAVTLYGPTSTELTGAVGARQRNMAANYPCAPCLSRKCGHGRNPCENAEIIQDPVIEPPCFSSLSPGMVWKALSIQILKNTGS